jgi:hypothetical protein
VSEELREDRVREVMALLEQARGMGTPVAVSKDGRHVGIMHTAVYDAVYDADDEAAEDAALVEAIGSGLAGGPVIAELRALTETEEGREILLEAHKRYQEAEENE